QLGQAASQILAAITVREGTPGLAPFGQLGAALGDDMVFVLLDRAGAGVLVGVFGFAHGGKGKSSAIKRAIVADCTAFCQCSSRLPHFRGPIRSSPDGRRGDGPEASGIYVRFP